MWKFLLQIVNSKIETFFKGYQAKISVSNEYIIGLALEYNGQLSAERLHRRTGMTENQAYERLVRLELSGVFLPAHKKFGLVSMFTLSEEYLHEAKLLQSNSPFILTDADYIEAAIDYGGRVSAAQICLRMRTSIDTSQSKLQELAEKGVFTPHIDDEGVIVYELRDRQLRA